MTTPTLAVETDYDRSSFAPLKVVASNNPTIQKVTLSNRTEKTVVATVSCPLARGENSRSWTAASVRGTVSGLDASGTGAISDTVTLEAGEVAEWTLTSTWDLTPVDANSDAIDFSTYTSFFTVTETTVGGVAVSDQDPVVYPLQSVYVGTGAPFFGFRVRDVERLTFALFGRMTDAQVAKCIDWFEMGHTFADLIDLYVYAQGLADTADTPGVATPASSGLF